MTTDKKSALEQKNRSQFKCKLNFNTSTHRHVIFNSMTIALSLVTVSVYRFH